MAVSREARFAGRLARRVVQRRDDLRASRRPHRDVSAVTLASHPRRREASPVRLYVVAGLACPARLEDLGDQLRVDALATVADRDPDGAAVVAEVDRDAATARAHRLE